MAKKKPAEERCRYELKITGFALGYGSREMPEDPCDEHFDFSLEVDLLEPVKGVTAGSLVLYGRDGHSGGSLNYDRDKYLHGCLWMGIAGGSALISLLVAGVMPTLVLYGKAFRYRSASVSEVGWYTDGHPELGEPDLE